MHWAKLMLLAVDAIPSINAEAHDRANVIAGQPFASVKVRRQASSRMLTDTQRA
jgi:hypothetical protein